MSDAAAQGRRQLGLGLTTLGVVVLLSCLACLGWLWWQTLAAVVEYQVPADYRGWVVVTYETPDCPRLSRRGLTQVIAIDASGRRCTASGPERRLQKVHVILVAADGSHTEVQRGPPGLGGVQVWHYGYTTQPQTQRNQTIFFVGTEDEARGKALPPDDP